MPQNPLHILNGAAKFAVSPYAPAPIETQNQFGGYNPRSRGAPPVIKRGVNTTAASSSSSSSSSSKSKPQSIRKAKATALKLSLTLVEPLSDEQKYDGGIPSDDEMTSSREKERNDTNNAMSLYRRHQQQFIDDVALLNRLLKLLLDAYVFKFIFPTPASLLPRLLSLYPPTPPPSHFSR
jgi:hypothetical protein